MHGNVSMRPNLDSTLISAGFLIRGSVLAQEPVSSTAALVENGAAAQLPAMNARVPPADTSSDALEGVRDIDYVGGLGNFVKADCHRGTNGNAVKYCAGASVLFGRHFANRRVELHILN